MTSREEALAAAGRAHAAAIARRDSLDPHPAALEAYEPGGPSVEAQTTLPAGFSGGQGPGDASPRGEGDVDREAGL